MRLKYFFSLALLLIIISSASYADWQKTQLATNSVNALHIYSNKLFVGTNGNGIFMSGNQGSSWNEVNTNLTNKYIWAITSSGSSLFCGTEGGGVFLSLTSGGDWKPANEGIGNLSIYNLGTLGTNLFALTDNAGVYRSILGTNWENVNNGMIIRNMYAIAISDSKIYIGGENGDIYMSNNNGDSWAGINPGDLKSTINTILVKNNKIFVGTPFGVFVTENEGVTWRHISNGLSNTDVSSLISSGDLIIAGTRGGGVFASANDGLSWREFNQGLDNLNIQCLAIDSKYLYAGTTSSLSRRLLSEIVIPVVLPPVLVSPANNDTNVPINVTFSWNASSGALSYHIQIAEDELMQNMIEDTDNLKNLYYNRVMEYSKTYYWRVAANTDNQEKKWSEKWSFTTIEGFGPPKLSYPQNKSKGILVLTDFSWVPVPEAVSYKLKIAEDNEFTIGVKLIENILTNTYTLTEPLKGYTTYYWQAAATDQNNNTLWSNEIWEFETGEPSGINEDRINTLSLIQIFPNPANEFIEILSETELSYNIQDPEIRIYNSLGECIQISIMKQQKQRINIKNIPSGLYYIKIGRSVKMFLKLSD